MNYFIWSKKHGGAFWRKGGHGYIDNPDMAGRFSEEEAQSICDPTHGECKFYRVTDKFIFNKRTEYVEKKKRMIRSCLETMTPKQVLEVMPELVQERIDLLMKDGI